MDKRDLILQTAEKLFSEKGYYGLGLTELLKLCDIPKGSFYYYFPNGKIQLLQDTLRRAYVHIAKGFEANLAHEDTALAAFDHMLDFWIAGLREKRHFASRFVAMIAIESVYLDPCIHQTCNQIYQDWQQLYVDRLIAFGYSPADSLEKGHALFSLFHGTMITTWVKQDPSDYESIRNALSAILSDAPEKTGSASA